MSGRSWRDCRRAARDVRTVLYGRMAVDRFRPRGVGGLFRARPPLAMLIWLADRRGLLVWQSHERFAVLDAPRGGPLAEGQPRSRFAFVDQWWDVLIFVLPLVAALLLAIGAGLTRTGLGLTAALVLIVLALAYVTTMLTGSVIRGAVELVRTIERPPARHPGVAVESVLFTHWSVALLHCRDATAVPRLLDEARSVVTPRPDGETEFLLYVEAAVSTAEARETLVHEVHVRRWQRDGRALVIRVDDRRPALRPGDPAAGSGNGISLLLVAILVWLLVTSEFVAAAERAACSARACADAPTTYGRALAWLAGRVLPFAAPGRLTAVSDRADLFGRGSTLLGYVGLACLAVAISRAAAAHRAYLDTVHKELIDVSARRPTIGIVTTLDVEYLAVRILLDDAVDVGVRGDRGLYTIGTLPSAGGGRHVVALIQLTVSGTNAAATACANLSNSFPSVNQVVLAGIAAGVPRPDRPDRHVRLGDIVVSTWGIADYDHVSVYAHRTEPRRGFPRPSPMLTNAVNRLKADALAGVRPWEKFLDPGRRPDVGSFGRPPADTDVLWDSGTPPRPVPHPDPVHSGHRPSRPKVIEGCIGSGDKALSDAATRDAYARRYDLVALEMEGSGVGDSAFLQGLEWMVVRGISDYGDAHRGDLWKPYASLAAAAYTRAMLAATPPQAARGGTPWPDTEN